MKKILFLTFMLLGMVTMSPVNAATNVVTATQVATTTYYKGTLTTQMASGKVRTTENFQNSYTTSDGTFGIDEFSIGTMPGTITVTATNFVADGEIRTYPDAVALSLFGGEPNYYDAKISATLVDGKFVYHIETKATYLGISFTAIVDFTGSAM